MKMMKKKQMSTEMTTINRIATTKCTVITTLMIIKQSEKISPTIMTSTEMKGQVSHILMTKTIKKTPIPCQMIRTKIIVITMTTMTHNTTKRMRTLMETVILTHTLTTTTNRQETFTNISHHIVLIMN